MSGDQQQPSRARNLTIEALAGQAGFSTVALIIIALLLGLWLDSQFGLKGPFTICLVILSVPLSLLVMLRIVRAATTAIRPPAQDEDASTATKEE